MEIGHVKPKRGHGEGLQALTWREWQRLRRFPQPLIGWAGTLVVPYASDALGMSAVTPVFGALALFGAIVPMLNGLRVLTRSGGLARCLPFSMAQIKMSMVTVPADPGRGLGRARRARLRGRRRRRPDATSGRVADGRRHRRRRAARRGPLDPGQGRRLRRADGLDPGRRVAPGLVTNLFRGFDVCLLATAPMLLGFSPLWSLAIEAITAVVLFNSFDADSMRARQQDAQRQLDLQKREREAQATVAKQRKR